MSRAIDEGGKLTAELLSTQPTTATDVTPSESLVKNHSQLIKVENDTTDVNIKLEPRFPSPRAASIDPQVPRQSLFSGMSHSLGVLNPSNVLSTPGYSDINISHSKTSSSGDKKTATRRATARTPKEVFARQAESKAKKLAAKSLNATVGGRVTKATSQKTRNKKCQSGEATSEKLKSKFTAADPFNLDLGTEAPIIQARTQREQFDKLRAAYPEYNNKNKRGESMTSLIKASRSFGYGKVHPLDGRWKLQGMDSALHHHQLIGASRMLERECSEEGPQGGILADCMGLGKTIQCIAAIIGNPPDSNKIVAEERTTLIVVPSGLLLQWLDELKKHGGSTIKNIDIYNRSDRRDAIQYTLSNVVITTYDELMTNLPWLRETASKSSRTKKSKGKKRNAADEEVPPMENFPHDKSDTAGVLYDVNWYRVIIDEGHGTRNHDSRASRAVNALKSRYRWVVTGTPFQNRLQDFYSYFRFLKDPETTTMSRFSADFCNSKYEECISRMEKKLGKLMIRRTMEDRVLGNTLIQLPKAHHKAIKVDFNAAEEILYRAVEEKFQELRDQDLEDDDPRKPMSYKFAQISFLRQLVSHPALVERKIMVLFDNHELEEIRDKVQVLDPVLYRRICSWIRGERAKVAAEYKHSLDQQIKICEFCQEDTEDLKEIPGCKHLFCDFCLNENPDIELAENGTEMRKCRACDEPYDPSELERVQEQQESAQMGIKKKGMKGKDFRNYIPGTPKSIWLDQYDRGMIDLRPGSKLEAVIEQVREWLSESPKEKIIIYTQWKMVSTIIGRMLEKENFNFLYYSGDMTQKTRSEVIRLYKMNPKVKILVSGLKCGGVGLNLPFANKVISVELWWNPFAEKQAFGRVYRIGQELETIFARVIVDNTIEDRLADLQLKKLRINSIAMQEKLSKEEEASLLERAESEKPLDLNAADCNEHFINALAGTDPRLNSNTDTLSESVQGLFGRTPGESPEDKIMEDVDDKTDEEGDFYESDSDSDDSMSDAPYAESMQAKVETEEGDGD
ncbi:putative dna repair helicase protein [Botrytis fragariae]|uniref:Putative dna repair helicase protein n=1 Tax=Botrytis fragariae TaxID=1964551 RepID=A0A8H6ALZ1_9HELO|nr:putative dna repair helicase protein [Botrytis fragariae]KAF5870203.1 putative dna repair helicase protein [Botrytis fragariae]